MYRYAVLGAGRQGIYAAYDLARYGNARDVLLADKEYEAAKRGAEQINSLTGQYCVRPFRLEVDSAEKVAAALVGVHAFISAMHYALNPLLTRAAIMIGAHMCDLGGNTAIVRRQHRYHAKAKKAGVSIVPDCGMGPGLNLSLARYALSKVFRPRTVRIYCGGLPQHPKLPLMYELLFSIDGLINEYSGFADVLKNGKLAKEAALTCMELVNVSGVGELEAAYTSGGLSTAPWTLRKEFPGLQLVTYKTLRYPPHWWMVRKYAKLGRLEEFLRNTLEPSPKPVEDIGIIRVVVHGWDKRGRRRVSRVECIDRADPKTGFTAMQRLTGGHAAIIARLAAENQLPSGVIPVESIGGTLIAKEARKRGLQIRHSISQQR